MARGLVHGSFERKRSSSHRGHRRCDALARVLELSAASAYEHQNKAVVRALPKAVDFILFTLGRDTSRYQREKRFVISAGKANHEPCAQKANPRLFVRVQILHPPAQLRLHSQLAREWTILVPLLFLLPGLHVTTALTTWSLSTDYEFRSSQISSEEIRDGV